MHRQSEGNCKRDVQGVQLQADSSGNILFGRLRSSTKALPSSQGMCKDAVQGL